MKRSRLPVKQKIAVRLQALVLQIGVSRRRRH
jgi:hypothetical protein